MALFIRIAMHLPRTGRAKTFLVGAAEGCESSSADTPTFAAVGSSYTSLRLRRSGSHNKTRNALQPRPLTQNGRSSIIPALSLRTQIHRTPATIDSGFFAPALRSLNAAV
jgi:hypothetical protein